MNKLDLYVENKSEYAAPKKPVLIDVAPAPYLAIAGRGKGGGPEFQNLRHCGRAWSKRMIMAWDCHALAAIE